MLLFTIQEVNLQHVVRRILINTMKQRHLEAVSAAGSDDMECAPPPEPAAAAAATSADTSDDDVIVNDAAAAELSEQSDDDDYEWATSDDGFVDMEVLASLPPKARERYLGMLNTALMSQLVLIDVILLVSVSARRVDRAAHRGTLVSVQHDPDMFSSQQLNHFLKQAQLDTQVRLVFDYV